MVVALPLRLTCPVNRSGRVGLRHVFFQKEDEDYIEKLLNKVVHNVAIPR
jgi:hypothetical protein